MNAADRVHHLKWKHGAHREPGINALLSPTFTLGVIAWFGGLSPEQKYRSGRTFRSGKIARPGDYVVKVGDWVRGPVQHGSARGAR